MTELFFTEALLPTGWAERVTIRVAAGRIVAVTAESSPSPQAERHGLALPGLANLHSHAFQRGMAGLTERRGSSSDSFWTWRDLMYRFVAKMSPEDVEAIAAQAYVEMLQAGFTRVGEFHYLHHDGNGEHYGDLAELGGRVAAAAAETRIRLTLLPVFYAHAGFGGSEPAAGQRRFLCDPDGYADLIAASRRAIAPLEGANLGVAPHSLRAATEAEIRAVLPLAEGGPVHLHIAEQVKEVDDCLAWSGERPVNWLLDRFDVDHHWCLVHATQMTDAETLRLAASGAVAGLCPITEANLGDGIFPGPKFCERGGKFGIGSDSNVLIDAAGELRQLEYSQRLQHRGRNILAGGENVSTGRAIFQAAFDGGAQALGVGNNGLAAGAPADIVSLDHSALALAGRKGDARLDSWIFAANLPLVDCVWISGKKCVDRGRHMAATAIEKRFRLTMERLLAA